MSTVLLADGVRGGVGIVVPGPYACVMSPTPADSGSVRSAAEWNEEIRALWFRAGGTLTSDERAEYERLLAGWAAAVRAEIVEAA